MGKGDKRGKNRHRNEQDWTAAVALAPTPRRSPGGRAKRVAATVGANAARETLVTRCNMAGMEVTKANLREAKAPWWGCCAGRIIRDADLTEKERKAYWDAICHMRKVVVAFDAALGIPKRHAICMNLLVASGWAAPVQSTETADERKVRTEAAVMQIENWLGKLVDKPAASAAKRCVIDDIPVSDQVGVLLALKAIVIGMTGKIKKDTPYMGRDASGPRGAAAQ